MSHNYPLSNFLGGLVKAQEKFKHQYFYPIASKFIVANLRLLMNEGYISGYRFYPHGTIKNVYSVIVFLKYTDTNVPLIRNAKVFSSPSRDHFISLGSLRDLVRKENLQLTVLVISTSCGLRTHVQCLISGLAGKFLYKIN